MKKIVTLFALLVAANVSNSQWVGPDAFLVGNYVEVGIDSAGGFEGADYNSATPPMAGLHFRGGNPYLGMVSDQFMAGWSGGNFDGDFYVPGSPENGWGFEILDTLSTGDTINVKANNNRSGFPVTAEIPGSITSYSNSGGFITVVWQGNYNSVYDIDFTLTYVLGVNDLYYTTYVDVVNNGPQNIEDFYFHRNMDPDNNQTIGAGFTTTNVIHGQRSLLGDPFTMVTADQTSPWYSLFGFYSTDTNSRAVIGGFPNRDASDLWWGTSAYTQTVGDSITSDVAVALAFRGIGLNSFTRSMGSPELHFSYITILGPQAYNYLMANAGVNEVAAIEVNLFPNPTSNVLSIQSKEIMNKLVVRDASGRIVANQNANSSSSTIDVSALKAGIYFITIEAEKGSVTKRFVKQ